MRIKNLKGKPALNKGKSITGLVILSVIIVCSIVWVNVVGAKAQETVTVAIYNQNIYKNQRITSSMLVPYEMLVAEYEKLTYTDSKGEKVRRVVLWEEVDQAIGRFAAYPLQSGKYVEKRDLTTASVDNSDSLLYSFPGKEIVVLSIGTDDLKAFSSFLSPGDKVNISAVYTDSVEKPTEYGTEKVDVIKTEDVFTDIMLADMLNSSGESVLDIYASYNEMSTTEQARLDNDTTFQESLKPATLLVALTSEEKERYYYYKSKQSVTFNMSLPQRLN